MSLAKIEEQEIVIRVPVNCLQLNIDYNNLNVCISDLETFAKEFVSAINSESEDGTTLVHKMLDKALVNTVEQGAEGVIYK
jgi:hypothetical protein